MSDWHVVVFNTPWIVGLATILAAFGYYYCQAAGKVRLMWQSSGFRISSMVGACLVCFGIALTARIWWLQGLWGVLSLLALFRAWQVLRAHREAE